MPVHKVKPPKGKKGPCYRWGRSGTVYCGRGAKSRAAAQGKAAYASGYKKKEALLREEILSSLKEN